MPSHPGCNNSQQQAQDRAAVVTPSSITPAKEEQTGLLESGIHLASVSTINSSLICLKIGATPCSQPTFRSSCHQAQHCMPSIQGASAAALDTWQVHCRETLSISKCCGLGEAFRWQQLSMFSVPPLVHWWLPKSLWPPQEMAYLQNGAGAQPQLSSEQTRAKADCCPSSPLRTQGEDRNISLY